MDLKEKSTTSVSNRGQLVKVLGISQFNRGVNAKRTV